MGISDEIRRRRDDCFSSVNHLVIIECLFSSRMSLASLCNHLCHFQSENVFQIPVTLRRKTIFDIK